METLTSWKNYLADGFRVVATEARQLSADARSEGYNIYNSLKSILFTYKAIDQLIQYSLFLLN